MSDKTTAHGTSLKLRLVARAVIVKDSRLLCIEVSDGPDSWWILPGGKVELGETVHESLLRELREELDCNAEIGDLISVREFIGSRHTDIVGKVASHHSVEFYFRATLNDVPDLAIRDENHLRVAWIAMEEFDTIDFRPRFLHDNFQNILEGQSGNVYLGETA